MIKEIAKQVGSWVYYRKPGITWDVESWMAEKAIQLPRFEVIREARDVQQFPAPHPACHGTQRVDFEHIVGTFRRYLAWVSGAMVVGVDGFTVMPDGTFLIQPAWAKELVTENPAYFKRFQPKSALKEGRWFNPLLYWHSSYYHWVCQVLPRFYQVTERLSIDVKIMVPGKMQPWMWDSLMCIGVEKSRCESFVGDRPWKIEELCYVPPVAMAADHDAEAMEWLRETVKKKLGIRGSLTTKIYLSRKTGASRLILNESELIPVLEAAGYNVIFAEDLGFSNQVALFSNASHVIAPHGGGLANLAWATPGCRVLEIFSPATIRRRCYWALCHTLGLEHSYIVGESEHTDPDGDYSLDIDLFKQALGTLEEPNSQSFA